MFAWLCKKIFHWWGWKLEGEIPHSLPKKLYVVVPHTSNWDFPAGILLKFGFKIDVGFIAKNSLFKWPYGWIFRALGGIPVDRKKSRGFIESVVNTIDSRENFSMAIAPEGTRKKVDKLKTGFYHISRLANIPVIYTKFDWKNKIAHFGPPRIVADTVEDELDYVSNYFKDVEGRNPEQSFGYPFDTLK